MNSKELISRWSQGVGASAQVAIVRSLQKQDPIVALSPFESVGNRADFRGFSAGTLSGISGAELSGIDLSLGNLAGVRLTDCTIRNVDFNQTSMKNLVDEKNRYENCDFQRTSFLGAQLGVGRSQFVGCAFNRCDFSGIRFNVVEFDKCVFDSCKLEGVDFGASSFADVTFIGRLGDVWFRGRDPFLEFSSGPAAQCRKNEMTGVSFAQAELWDVTFSDNCPLSTVILPNDGDHHFFDRWPDRLNSALATIATWDDSLASNYVASFLPHAQNQTEFILNYNEVITELGKDVGKRVFKLMTSYTHPSLK